MTLLKKLIIFLIQHKFFSKTKRHVNKCVIRHTFSTHVVPGEFGLDSTPVSTRLQGARLLLCPTIWRAVCQRLFPSP